MYFGVLCYLFIAYGDIITTFLLIIIIIERTHSKTILENTVEIEP